jgi:anti-sigma B factor antagonist
MQISSVLEDENYLITIDGDVDASSSIKLDEAISEAIQNGQQQILIDCVNLNYISSAGLGVFMSYIEELKAKNIRMVLFGLSDKVENVFKVLGLDQLLSIEETKDQAKQQAHG